MKKIGKIILITIVTLISVLIVTISVVLWLVFTPERFTPIARKQAEKFISCQTEIGEVELTLFSTFPNFGFKLRKFVLINPVADSPSDTLVSVNELVFEVDAEAWWKRNELILTGLELNGGYINLFSDSLGRTNYDIMATDTASIPDSESASEMPAIDIRNVVLKDVNIHYNDLALKLSSVIRNLSASMTGVVREDSISGKVKVSRSEISVGYGDEKYLQQASVKFELPVDFIPSRQFINLKNAKISVNELELLINGTVENDTVNKNIITDIKYSLKSWPVKSLMALVPSSYNSYFEGMDVDGLLSSNGSVRGLLNDKSMPLMDINLLFEKGRLKYEGFPLPLNDMEADLAVYTDLSSDALSYVRIRKFSARTPHSVFRTEGLVNRLFSDIYIDLTTNARLKLDEFNQMIPDSMKVDLKGRAEGKVRTAFSMSQMEKMQIEKMELSGSVSLSEFHVRYDSIFFSTDRSKIEFALPNNNSATNDTKFAFASILMANIEAGKLETYSALLQNASFTFETSDVRDTTKIPHFICSFSMDSLSAEMDTLSLDISKPFGKVDISPRSGNPDQPRIIFSFNSEKFNSAVGQNSAVLQKINLESDIQNDNTQKDIFLQWLIKGSVDFNQGTITMSDIAYPIEIPSVKMSFDPENFNIKESKVRIDKSDFQLSGYLNNVLSYFRGDSLLKGKFTFISDNTDISQLMALTNGIGDADTTAVKVPENVTIDSTYTGPYMVPKGIDLQLNASIKRATMGVDVASNIKGIVQVADGILLLDGLTFETPAARMQLTAMYRTPRKNHLFLGIDYHMLDVEIGELLTMIPDIDTLMPMLRSFGGKGEFHIAVETYMDSLYNLKRSTLRGASSIKGNNLVLMDGETFSEIAKTLRFSKKTQNKVDSLSAEFTIFRNEIDIYPFLIVMDKYKAVVAGRHNFDLTFDYHISVVDCPLPIKLGVDIKGNMDDMSYSLAKCRYAEYYRPSSRRAVENKQLELSKMIRETLTQKVRE